LFIEQEKAETQGNRSKNLKNNSEWDLNSHKIMYQEAMDRRRVQLNENYSEQNNF
jgi:hypothetical protein